MTRQHRAIVLAGERGGANALAGAFDAPAAVLVDVAGEPSLSRVLNCLAAVPALAGGVLCGPDAAAREGLAWLDERLERVHMRWLAPCAGPAASALAAAAGLEPPVLLTTADHALLSPATVSTFIDDCEAAAQREPRDLYVGLVPYPLVQRAFPGSRRTILRFADGAFCGSNLFLLRTPAALAALSFWRQVEALRKQPIRIAAAIGWGTLLRYGTRRLTRRAAMERLSARSGCSVGAVDVADPRAAVDVDSYADWQLADRLLREDTHAVGLV